MNLDHFGLRPAAIGLCLLVTLQFATSVAFGVEAPPAAAEPKTASFRCVSKLANDPPVVQRYFVTTNEIRADVPSEQAEGILESDLTVLASMIHNVRLKRSVEISYVEQQVQVKQLNESELRHCQNPAAAIYRIVTNEAKLLREETVAGRPTQVYRVDKLDFLFSSGPDAERDSATLWLDRETRLPIQIELESGSRDGDPAKIVFDEFVWNAPLDAELFSLTPPAGFVVVDAEGQTSP